MLLFSASQKVTKVVFLSTLTMALLLSCSTATKSFRTAFQCSLRPRHVSYMAGRATPRHDLRPTTYTQSLFSGHHANPIQVCKPRHHYFTTLQDANTSVEDTSLFDNNEQSNSKQKTRKQRRKKTKEINLTRIDKVLAHRGVGTRRETFELAKSKRITFATHSDTPHGERTRIRGPKDKVPFEACIFLDGNLLPGPPPLLLVYHKPKYVLSVMKDDPKYEDQQRKHLGDMLEQRYKMAGIHPVGRLDYDTTGLILFSLDGKLTQMLLHPRRGIEKEYVATVQGLADEAKLAKKLSDGVKTTDGVHKAKLIAVTPSDGPEGDDELEEIMMIESEEEEDVEVEEAIDNYSGPHSDVRLVVSEGKYRMVRRMLANCGHPVAGLRRLRHGEVELGDLKVGEFRQATEDELEWAKSLITK